MRSLRKLVFDVSWAHLTILTAHVQYSPTIGPLDQTSYTFFVNTLSHVFAISYFLYAYTNRHFVRSVCQPILDDKRSGNFQDNPDSSHHYGRVELYRAILKTNIENINIKVIMLAWIQQVASFRSKFTWENSIYLIPKDLKTIKTCCSLALTHAWLLLWTILLCNLWRLQLYQTHCLFGAVQLAKACLFILTWRG